MASSPKVITINCRLRLTIPSQRLLTKTVMSSLLTPRTMTLTLVLSAYLASALSLWRESSSTWPSTETTCSRTLRPRSLKISATSSPWLSSSVSQSGPKTRSMVSMGLLSLVTSLSGHSLASCSVWHLSSWAWPSSSASSTRRSKMPIMLSQSAMMHRCVELGLIIRVMVPVS